MEKIEKIDEHVEKLDPSIEAALDADIIDKKNSKGGGDKLKWLRTYSLVTGAVALSMALNYLYRFRDKVEVTSVDGKLEYHHSDKETEHILNVLSGHEDLTDKEKLYVSIYMVINWCKKRGIEVPKDIRIYSQEQIKSFLESFLEKEATSSNPIWDIEGCLSMKPFEMEKLHNVLWEMEKKNGSPIIRWSDQDRSSLSNEEHRAHYSSFTNTIYITPEHLSYDMHKQFVAEVSHAQQFYQVPVEAFVSSIKDVTKTFVRSMPNFDFEKEYHRLYEEEDTGEYDAHKVREPKLENEADFAKRYDAAEDYNKNGSW